MFALMTLCMLLNLCVEVQFTRAISYKSAAFSINHHWIEVNGVSDNHYGITKIVVKLKIFSSNVHIICCSS